QSLAVQCGAAGTSGGKLKPAKVQDGWFRTGFKNVSRDCDRQNGGPHLAAPFCLPWLFFSIVAECLRRRRQRPGWWPRTIRFSEKHFRVFASSFPVRTTTHVVDH